MNNSIAAIILTYNEEKHISRCINSVKDVCNEIWVIDSFSTDKTCEIATKLGAKVRQHAFENQALQFNWAIENCDFSSGWLWRIDADEYLENIYTIDIKEKIRQLPISVNGIYINRKIVFMGKALLHGGWYPAPQIKIIRKGYGCCENKCMDEHLVILSGETISLNIDQVDNNLNDLSWWTNKHNNYSDREAVNLLKMEYGLEKSVAFVRSAFCGKDEEHKRWLKQKYAKAPLFVRPFVNFFYRYVLRGGFLDGKEGFVWHVLQGFWYRMLVDAKIYELKKRFGFDDDKIKEYIKTTYLK